MLAPGRPPLPPRDWKLKAEATPQCWQLSDTAMPSAEVLARSEFLLPLTAAGRAQYSRMFDSCGA